MKIQFIFGGTRGGDDIQHVAHEYYSRLTRTESVDIVYASTKSTHEDVRCKEESQAVLKHIKADDFVVVFDERGKDIDSRSFADVIERCEADGKRLVVCVGGSHGVTDEVRNRADMIVSFSRMIFPHELARVMALEQVYRARSITRGSKYHHEG